MTVVCAREDGGTYLRSSLGDRTNYSQPGSPDVSSERRGWSERLLVERAGFSRALLSPKMERGLPIEGIGNQPPSVTLDSRFDVIRGLFFRQGLTLCQESNGGHSDVDGSATHARQVQRPTPYSASTRLVRPH